MDWKDCHGVLKNSEICGGEYIFSGTRVPIRALFENLRNGATIYEFVKWFPSVSLKAAKQTLRFLEMSLRKNGAARPL